jgi:MtaA/CmuA family methyltransferase
MDDIRKCVNLERPSRVPVFACSEEFDVRVAGEVYADYNSDAKTMARVQIGAIKRFDYDWAWLQVDDCIEFEVLGVGVKGEGNILPATCDYLPASYETVQGLKMPDPKRDGRMPVLLDAIRMIKDEFGDTVCVTGRTAAPFSSVTLLYGMTQTFMAMYDQPELIRDTINFFVDLQSLWGCAQIEAGADAIWFGDCNASGHLISVADYVSFAAGGVSKCVQAYDSAGGLSIYHASEHDLEHMKVQAATGVSALSVGPGVDIAVAKEAVGDVVCLVGNVDPIAILTNGTPDQVCRETRRIVEIGKKGGGYIFNSGEMIPRAAPEENITAMVEAARKSGLY